MGLAPIWRSDDDYAAILAAIAVLLGALLRNCRTQKHCYAEVTC